MASNMIQIHIPLYTGTEGDLFECIRGDGNGFHPHKPMWITPGFTAETDELPIHVMRIYPKLHRFEGKVVFEIMDEMQKSRPLKVAQVEIDCDRKAYRIHVEERYRLRRLNQIFYTHGVQQPPSEDVARMTKTPYMDWQFGGKRDGKES